jgi:hypothetical protein
MKYYDDELYSSALYLFNLSSSKENRVDLSGYAQKTDKKYPSYKYDALAKADKAATNAGFAKEPSPRDSSPKKIKLS